MAIIYPPSGGKIYGDTKVYPPSSGKIYPGTAYPSGVNPAWPFTDIPLPPFLWRPDLTGDYSNVGSDGAALDLTPAPDSPFNPQGYPPPLGSFDGGWVISNPTGNESSVAVIPYQPDVSDLGSIFSIIIKAKMENGTLTPISTAYGVSGGNGPGMDFTDSQPFNFGFQADADDYISYFGTQLLYNGNTYIIIITFNNGVTNLYVDGINDPLIVEDSSGVVTSLPDVGQGIIVGDASDYPDDPSGDGSIIMIEGIHKGIEYTPAQAAAITAGLI